MISRLDYVNKFCDINNCDDAMQNAIRATYTFGLSRFLSKQGVIQPTAMSIAKSTYYLMCSKILHYHTPVHILSIFQFAEKINRPLENWEKLAIWFHDVIHYPGFKDNAFASARLMESMLAGTKIDKTNLKEAIAAIKTTSQHLKEWVNPKHAFIMDLDLAMFSFPEKSYNKCLKYIRMEHKISETKYQKSRVDFLSCLLKNRKKLYRTPSFAVFENQARNRIKLEITDLLRLLAREENAV